MLQAERQNLLGELATARDKLGALARELADAQARRAPFLLSILESGVVIYQR
jgi:hypothetical protein